MINFTLFSIKVSTNSRTPLTLAKPVSEYALRRYEYLSSIAFRVGSSFRSAPLMN